MLPFCIFIGVPILVLSRIIRYSASSSTRNLFNVLISWMVVALLIFLLPEKWRMWKRMWVWSPIRRFFRSTHKRPNLCRTVRQSWIHSWSSVWACFDRPLANYHNSSFPVQEVSELIKTTVYRVVLTPTRILTIDCYH
ncbi:hypothetical protein B0F90DRAFT_992003 [Multifurca ochricompacta]|uniref:Uncharacterized protein n=1 Tax=Multifurca ochricompacta TaxID=376703 RepID=A0AAD4M2B8_9AGAM|nr:hypothetical protein B0F90DRAFT_992003 [Multifurca ochricompacta]